MKDEYEVIIRTVVLAECPEEAIELALEKIERSRLYDAEARLID